MNFPFISISDATGSLYSDLPKMAASNRLSEASMYQWAIECLRLIQISTYIPFTVYLNVEKFNSKLPKGFYLAEDIFLCEPVSAMAVETVGFTMEDYKRYWKPTALLRPAKTPGNVGFVNNDHISPGVSPSDLSYFIRATAGLIRFSFKKGVIKMNYQSLPMGLDGNIVMQDEENHIQAVQFYIKAKLFEEDYYLQKTPRYVFEDIKNQRDTYIEKAQSMALALDQADMNYLIEQQNNRYRQFQL